MRSKESIQKGIVTTPRQKAGLEMITQKEIAIYKELVEAEKTRLEKRLDFLKRLEAGAIIEPGIYTLNVEEREFKRCTWVVLEEILGPDTVQDVREAVVPTPTKYLTISTRGDARV